MQVPLRANLSRTYAAVADAAGVAVATISPTSSVAWVVTQVTAEVPDAPNGSTCELRLNGALVAPLIPTGDVAAGEPPVRIGVGDRLTVEWTNLDPLMVGRGLVLYDEAPP